MTRLRFRTSDKLAAGLAVLLLVSGALYYPIYNRVYPLEGLRGIWRAEENRALVERLNDWSSAPLWADAEGKSLPAGYPNNLGAKNVSENMRWLERRFGREFQQGKGWVQGDPYPDEQVSSLPTVPGDTWGNPWWLTVSWKNRRRAIVSTGPDGELGTPDDLEVFSWGLNSFDFSWPMRFDLLFYLCAGLWTWAYVVLRAKGLPRLEPVGLEVPRALVVVSPWTVLCLVISGGVVLPSTLSSWTRMQLVPTWVAVTLTVTFVLVLGVLWRRLRSPRAEESASR